MIFIDDIPKEYLTTQPPIAGVLLTELFELVAADNSRNIDGIVLSNLLKFCFYFGLKKSELLDLEVGHILDDRREISSTLKVAGKKSRDISITAETVGIVEDQINYLRESRYRRGPRAPLFPSKNNQQYSARRLQRDLSKYFDGPREEMSLEKIRQAGACRFYDNLKLANERPTTCLTKTAEFLGVGKTAAAGILSGRIPPTGIKKSALDKHNEEVSALGELVRRCINKIRTSIEIDPDLKEVERAILKDELARVVSIGPEKTAPTTPVRSVAPSLADMLKSR
jgi:hypothetical protein